MSVGPENPAPWSMSSRLRLGKKTALRTARTLSIVPQFGNRYCMVICRLQKGTDDGPTRLVVDFSASFQGLEAKAMSLSPDQVRHIAHLARLRIDDGDVQQYATNLSRIVDFVDQLGQADTASVTPMAHPLDMVQRLRDDEVTESNHRDEYQENAPAIEAGLYLVPRVIE